MNLIEAVEDDDIEIVRTLLDDERTNINVQNKMGDNALMRASLHGCDEIVELLLDDGRINVNKQNNYGNSALRISSIYGYTKIVKMLLQDKRTDVNPKTCKRTCWMGLLIMDIMKLLIAKGANSKNPLDPTSILEYKDVSDILRHWKPYLPKFSIRTCKYYPEEFKDIVITWLLVCKRKKKFKISKDIKMLMLKYIAEVWKNN